MWTDKSIQKLIQQVAPGITRNEYVTNLEAQDEVQNLLEKEYEIQASQLIKKYNVDPKFKNSYKGLIHLLGYPKALEYVRTVNDTNSYEKAQQKVDPNKNNDILGYLTKLNLYFRDTVKIPLISNSKISPKVDPNKNNDIDYLASFKTMLSNIRSDIQNQKSIGQIIKTANPNIKDTTEIEKQIIQKINALVPDYKIDSSTKINSITQNKKDIVKIISMNSLENELQDIYYNLTNPNNKNKTNLANQYSTLIEKRKELITKLNNDKRKEAGILDSFLDENLSSSIVKPLQKYGIVDETNELSYNLPKFESYTERENRKREDYLTSTRFEDLDISKHPFERFRFRYSASNQKPIKVQLYGTREERENQNLNIKSKGTLLHFIDQSPQTGYMHNYTKNQYNNLHDNDYLGVLNKNKDDSYSIKYEKKKDILKNQEDLTKNTFLIRQTKFDDIDFNKKVPDPNFKGHTYWKDKNLNTQTIPISSAKDNSLYTYSSGQSVVFIFEYKGETRYVHFSNSPKAIKEEGERIKKDYNLMNGQLIIGIADAGSYSSNIRGNITNDLLNSKDYGYYNMNKKTGAGAAIIKQ